MGVYCVLCGQTLHYMFRKGTFRKHAVCEDCMLLVNEIYTHSCICLSGEYKVLKFVLTGVLKVGIMMLCFKYANL